MVASKKKRRCPHTGHDSSRLVRQFWTTLNERLVKDGADVNVVIADPTVSMLGALQFLVAHGANVNAVDDNKQNPLMHYVDSGSSRYADLYDDSVAFLISKGANVNAVDSEGNTPLLAAVKCNSVKEIGRLIAAGANVNVKNKSGQTPLALANLAMQNDAAALLKSNGGTE
jgi:ankyrin repeat protein